MKKICSFLVIMLIYVVPAFSMTAQELTDLIKRAEQSGDPEVMKDVGLVYYRGSGVEQDYPEAYKWFLKAAELGNAEAQNFLGVMYYDGKGIPQNYNEAYKWYFKSAQQNYHWGQYNVGMCYEHGRGVKENRSEAIRWYELAAKQGNEEAKRAISSYNTEQIGKLVLGGLLLGGLAYFLSGNDDRNVNKEDSFSAPNEEESKTKLQRCGLCNGTGKCQKCDGTGHEDEFYDRSELFGLDNYRDNTCRTCYGTGKCERCDGNGKLDLWGRAVDMDEVDDFVLVN